MPDAKEKINNSTKLFELFSILKESNKMGQRNAKHFRSRRVGSSGPFRLIEITYKIIL
jgi:hypothetical protein